LKQILLIGLRPAVVDLSRFPDLTAETLTATLEAQERSLCQLGLGARWCLVDLGETAEAVVRAALAAVAYDGVLIGAGVRTVPVYLRLFERLINVVHECAPAARICFNTRPEDTQEAVLRWISAPGSTGQ
jgi:hypothetical protein